MYTGGIFQAFGATDLAGQTLSLRTIGPTGAAVPNPLAMAMQAFLNKGAGFQKLPIDGRWGDCSQKAFKNYAGAYPTPVGLVMGLDLRKFGVEPDAVKVWNKTTGVYCDGGSDVKTGEGNRNVSSVLLVSKMFGLPVPAGACDSPRVPNTSTSTCECPPGMYEDAESGECAQLERPQSLPPSVKTPTIVTPGLRLPLQPTIPSTRRIMTFTPLPSRTALLQNLQLAPVTSDRRLRFSLKPGATPSQPGAQPGPQPDAPAPEDKGGQPGGMNPVAALALIAVAVGGVGALGYWLYSRSKTQTALANFYMDNFYHSNCGENQYGY